MSSMLRIKKGRKGQNGYIEKPVSIPYLMRAQSFVDTIDCFLSDRVNLEEPELWKSLRDEAERLIARYRAFRLVPITEDGLEISEQFEGFRAGTGLDKIMAWFENELGRISEGDVNPVPQIVEV